MNMDEKQNIMPTRGRRVSGARIGQDPPVNAFCGANRASRGDIHERYPSCLKSLDGRRRGTRFCNARCRLLHWAVGELGRALASGQAEGLRAELRKLGEVDKG